MSESTAVREAIAELEESGKRIDRVLEQLDRRCDTWYLLMDIRRQQRESIEALRRVPVSQ